ncbi:MAG: glutathione ABC transporter permease GsiC, partial [Deinococcus sp.]|nr:glutathione ABC transporter permease GsiC [Deinococcus sp.]
MGLTRYVFGRLGQLLPVVVGMSIASFLLVHLIPGNAIELYLGTQVSPTPEQMEELKRIFGLSGPIYEQYGRWALRILHGDMGYSLRTGQPVLPSILNALQP